MREEADICICVYIYIYMNKMHCYIVLLDSNINMATRQHLLQHIVGNDPKL